MDHTPERLTPSRAPRIAVCVATANRPQGLRRLLRSLAHQQFVAIEEPRVEVVIVDNSPAAAEVSARHELFEIAKLPLTVLHETRPGVSFARNMAVAAAVESNDLLAFVDDDEAVGERWLEYLLTVCEDHNADAACGPVVPLFTDRPPAWMLRGGFGSGRRRPSGTPVPVCYTGNVLVRTDVFRRVRPWFDERFALTGGEDTDFFLRAAAEGCRFVHADEAVVWTFVPAQRLSARWRVRRAFMWGQNEALRMRHADTGFRQWADYCLEACAETLKGSAVAFRGVFRGGHVAVRGLQRAARGLGSLGGTAGFVHRSYRKPVPEAVGRRWYCLPADVDRVPPNAVREGQVVIFDRGL